MREKYQPKPKPSQAETVAAVINQMLSWRRLYFYTPNRASMPVFKFSQRDTELQSS